MEEGGGLGGFAGAGSSGLFDVLGWFFLVCFSEEMDAITPS